MTLSFSQKFPDKSPTYFVEKIINSIKSNKLADIDVMTIDSKMNYSLLDKFGKLHPKIHTIRSDEKNRWRDGMNIHFVINNRTKNRFQFAPILPVKSIQKFRVSWDEGIVHVYIDDVLFYTNIGYHSKFIEFHKQMQKFAENDGFESIEKFLQWFSEDFEGKIIHWTDFSYLS